MSAFAQKVIASVMASLMVVYMGVLSANQAQLARYSEWMRGTELRLSGVENYQRELSARTSDRYTRREAEKDINFLLQKMESMKK